MKKKLLSMTLAIVIVLSMLSVMIFTASAADKLAGVFFNEEPTYVVPQTTDTTFYSDEAAIDEGKGQREITLWFNVRNLKTPIYLAAVTIGFKTDDGSAFGSVNTGGVNLQNYGFPIESDGDYLLRVPLNTNLAWDWKEEKGGFKAITKVTGRAYDKGAYDNGGAVAEADCEVALMGILSGEVTLENQSATYYNALGETDSIGTGTPTLEQAAIKVVPKTGDATSGGEKIWNFSQVVAPVTPTPKEGDAFTNWVDEKGHNSLPGLTDKLYATYKKAEIYSHFKGDSIVVSMNSTDNKLTLRTETPSLGIDAGTVYVEYDASLLSFEDGADGRLEVPFDSVADDGKITDVSFDAVPGVAGNAIITLSGKASINGREVVILLDATTRIEISGQQTGVYFTDSEPVPFNKSEGEAAPATQTLWQGNAVLGGASGFSVVYKLEGVDDPIDAYQLAIEYNGGSATDKTYHWFWNQTNEWAGAPSPRYQTFDKDGTYVMYIDSRIFDNKSFKTLNAIRIFTTYCTTDSEAKAVNTNENATFQILAITAGSLKPTVTFHDAESKQIGEPCTYDYISPFNKNDNNTAGINCKQILQLKSPESIFEAASEAEDAALKEAEEPSDKVYVEPTKEQDKYYSYKFVGWEDANGNRVDGVYMNMDLYPIFEKTILDPVSVTFSIDGVEAEPFSIPRGTAPTYTGTTPTKPSDDNYSYIFRGWTTDEKKVLAATPKDAEDWAQNLEEIIAQENITVYAVFEQVERIWEITFYEEDKVTEIGKRRVRQGEMIDLAGQKADPPTASQKPATQQYTYTFDKWVDAEGKPVELLAVTADTKVYASYTATLNKYTVTFLDEDKKTKLGDSTVDYGTAATAPTDPTKAEDDYYTYAFDKWVNEDGTDADFSNVTEDITVYASYKATFKNPFGDADLSRYYGAAVEYVTANGIMNGTDATHFSPNGTATRGMIVTVLYRMEGSPSVEGMENKFSDVPEGKYYTDAVIWASNVGVVNGTGDNVFSPNNNVTREQFATMIYRYADQIKGYYMSCGNASLTIFADKNDISTYATGAVKWAIASEKDMSGQGITYYNKTALIEGIQVDENTVNMNPKGNATRGQMATMLYRFITGEHLAASDIG